MGAGPLNIVVVVLFGIALILGVLTCYFAWTSLDVAVDGGWGFRGFQGILVFPWATLGALLVWRQPRNLVGWILLSVGVFSGIQGLFEEFIPYATAHDLSVPGLWVWGNDWWWIAPTTTSLIVLPLVFPQGKPPLAILWLAVPLFLTGMTVITQTPITDEPPVVTIPLMLSSFAMAGSAIVMRFRRGDVVVRNQMKFFLLSVALSVLMTFLSPTLAALGEGNLFIQSASQISTIGIFLIPVGIAAAVLRYRLYDIDLLINRTLVYGLLTGVLAGSYFGLIALFQLILDPFTSQSDLTIAASTLGVAALFQPLRRGIQAFIDRRFYRARYDAAETLDLFTARLRDQVDLESLTNELVGVVGTTMHPAHASLWLKNTCRWIAGHDGSVRPGCS